MRLITGNAISVIAIALSLFTSYAIRDFQIPLRILILIICWFSMLYFTHCLSHYFVGKIFGIKFSHYTLSKSMLSKANLPFSKLFSMKIFLTLRIKERGDKRAMFFMFISGPLASILSPFLIAAIAYSYDKFGSLILLMLSIANGIFSAFMSYRHGCIRKAILSLKTSDFGDIRIGN